MLIGIAAALVIGGTGFDWWFWAAFLGWVMCAAVTASKGTWGVLVIDVFLWCLSYVAALRLAKPHSLWARKFYDREKMHQALFRYGGPPSRFELEELGA